MSIQEKQSVLEFSFSSDKGNFKCDIVYDGMSSTYPISISSGGVTNNYPLDLFVEIVDFLKGKGVIPSIRPRLLESSMDVPNHNRLPVDRQKPIPLIPDIKRKDDINPKEDNPLWDQIKNSKAFPPFLSTNNNIDPLSSFDISKVLEKPSIQEDSGEDSEYQEETIVSNIEEADKKDVNINRPVIRTRVSGNDPKSAEKEADSIRSAMRKKDKSIKKI